MKHVMIVKKNHLIKKHKNVVLVKEINYFKKIKEIVLMIVWMDIINRVIIVKNVIQIVKLVKIQIIVLHVMIISF